MLLKQKESKQLLNQKTLSEYQKKCNEKGKENLSNSIICILDMFQDKPVHGSSHIIKGQQGDHKFRGPKERFRPKRLHLQKLEYTKKEPCKSQNRIDTETSITKSESSSPRKRSVISHSIRKQILDSQAHLERKVSEAYRKLEEAKSTYKMRKAEKQSIIGGKYDLLSIK